MGKFKFLILLFYYDRPRLVLNTLDSISKLNYDNYEVAFIDDGSLVEGEDIVIKDFSDLLGKTKFYYINTSVDEKIKNGGSIFGSYANEAIKNSDADIGIMLCDDDALTPDYLINLNLFFNRNPNINYCYSNLLFYNPEIESYKDFSIDSDSRSFLNNENTPINPCRKIDMSQVAWKLNCNKEYNIWFPFPQTMDLDLSLFTQLYEKFGNCMPTNFYGQVKGVFSGQLGNREAKGYIDNNREMMMYNTFDVEDIWNISEKVYKIQQKKHEWKELLMYVKNNCKLDNALEIGCYGLGSTYGLCKLFNNVVSIDIEKRDNWDDFKTDHDNWKYIVGDSKSSKVIEEIKDKKYDLIFIDGDHTYEGSKSDFVIYKNFLKEDGIIIFHDIIESDLHAEYNCYVSRTWNEIKHEYNYKEMLLTEGMDFSDSFKPYSYRNSHYAMNKDWGGIGVLTKK